jgi:hypothetical protein
VSELTSDRRVIVLELANGMRSGARRFDSTYASTIRTALPNTIRFVLKAPDLERGEGVCVVTDAELEPYLGMLLCDATWHSFRTTMSMSSQNLNTIMECVGRWRETDSSEFLVEEYVASKPVVKDGQIFDATMRVMCLLTRSDGQCSCFPFAHYWKLPPKSVDDMAATMREKTVSSFSADRHDAVAVDEADRNTVSLRLTECLSHVYAAILGTDVVALSEKLPASTVAERDLRGIEFLRLANVYMHYGRYIEAHALHARAAPLCLERARVEHETGVLLQTQERHVEALVVFERILQQYPSRRATLNRRAMSQQWLNDNEMRQ